MGIIFDLIASNFSDIEVTGVRVRKVPAADRGRWAHGKRLGERDADPCFDIKKLKKGLFFSVIGAGRVTWGGPNTLILFLNERY